MYKIVCVSADEIEKLSVRGWNFYGQKPIIIRQP